MLHMNGGRAQTLQLGNPLECTHPTCEATAGGICLHCHRPWCARHLSTRRPGACRYCDWEEGPQGVETRGEAARAPSSRAPPPSGTTTNLDSTGQAERYTHDVDMAQRANGRQECYP